MFLAALILILSGLPVAFILGGCALAFGGIGILAEFIAPIQMTNIVPRIFGSVISNNVLVAVPLFIFMGTLLNKTEIAGDLLESLGWVLRKVPGGQAVAVVVLGTIMAATTGIVGASVVTLSLMAIPVLRDANYSMPLTYGVVAASGTLGILIPPSIMLVILGNQIQVPVGALFAGALFPGLFLSFTYIVYVIALAWIKPSVAPRIERANEVDDVHIKRRLFLGLVPPALLIFSVLGSILLGFATPTEAAGVGVVGAIVLGLLYRKLDRAIFSSSIDQTAVTNALVFFIFFGATAFAYVFRILDGEYFVVDLLNHINIDTVQEVVIFMMLVVFILGFFFDFIEISLITLPIFVPVLMALDVASVFGSAQVFWVWFAMLLSVNLQTSFLTPPFGFTLFYLKGTDPEGIKLRDIYLGIIPFVLIQLAALTLIYLKPEIVLHLPVSLGLAS